MPSSFRDISRNPDVPASTRELEDALNNVQDPSELRQTLLHTLAQQGTIVRSQNDEFDTRLIVGQPQTPDASLPANGFRYEKELTFDPESGRKNLMLRANTMEDLAALERQILGY